MADGLTDEQVQKYVENYKRKQSVSVAKKYSEDNKVFVNRSVSMDRIKYIGFDMDHTLVVYKSPAYEILAFEMAVDRLIAVGYPQKLKELEYDPTFPLRGLLFDKIHGNLLKVDQFGNILSCFHGSKALSPADIRALYPNKYLQPTDERIFILNTLYNLPEVFLLASLIDLFDSYPDYVCITAGSERNCGVKSGDVFISYKMIWQDVRAAMDYIHIYGDYKKRTLEDLGKYVQKDPRLPKFLDKLRHSGRKIFVATNSGYKYTKEMLSFLLEDKSAEGGRSWKSYFDYIIVDAKKPLFFQEGSMLREVDEETGSLRLGIFSGELQPGKVYNGGSSAAFCKHSGAHGKQILYVGDHIFGDVIKAKKEQAWRTFLVIPELSDEVAVWESCQPLFSRLQNLEFILAEMYTKLNEVDEEERKSLPDIASLRRAIKKTAQLMEESYPSQMGSLLRCGSRQTHFGNQATRFADLYASSFLNLGNYPDNYLFTAPHQLMPHESAMSSVSDQHSGPRSPIPPELVAKLQAKSINQKTSHQLVRGLSIIENDLDEVDGMSELKSK